MSNRMCADCKTVICNRIHQGNECPSCGSTNMACPDENNDEWELLRKAQLRILLLEAVFRAKAREPDEEKLMTIGKFRKLSKDAPDSAIICVDTEARCFNAHLISIKHASLLEKECSPDPDEELFILYPSYDGTSHYREKGE